jgi:ribonuclease HII
MAQPYELDDEALSAVLAEHGFGGPLLCGIDEAGRGALAGPVVAAAVVFRVRAIAGLADSKAISKKRRETLFDELQTHAFIGVGVVLPEVIDSINILQANFRAMQMAIASLVAQGVDEVATVLVDGNHLTTEIKSQCARLGIAINTVIKGDARVAEISAASIVAKVTRDRIMAEAELANPGYGFAENSGYPSPAHLSSLQALGVSPLHRKSFAPVAACLAAASPQWEDAPHAEQSLVQRPPEHVAIGRPRVR